MCSEHLIQCEKKKREAEVLGISMLAAVFVILSQYLQ